MTGRWKSDRSCEAGGQSQSNRPSGAGGPNRKQRNHRKGTTLQMQRTCKEWEEIRQLIALGMLIVDKERLKGIDPTLFLDAKLAGVVAELQAVLNGDKETAMLLRQLTDELGVEWNGGTVADALFSALELDRERGKFRKENALGESIARYMQTVDRLKSKEPPEREPAAPRQT